MRPKRCPRSTDEVEERRRTIAGWVDDFGHRAYAFARTLVDTPEEAQDLVQEAWLVVLEHRGKLPADEMARAWVFEIVRRLGVNRIRTTKRRRRFFRKFGSDLPRPESPGDPELDRDALVREVLLQIEALPRLQRHVLVARLIDGRSVRETAHDLGRAEGTVKGSLARGIATLRARLGEEWEDALKRAPLRRRPMESEGGPPGAVQRDTRDRSDVSNQEEE